MNTQTFSPDDPQAALGELADEFLTRHRRGENPRISDYAKRHPALEPEIRRLFPTLIVLEKCGSTVEAPPALPSESVPERVGEYRVVGRIGEGGMGVVYEAVQEPLGRRVALKFLRASCTAGSVQRERFLRETRAAARLSHPHIVTVYGTGEHDGVPYYAMQLVRGRGLEYRIAQSREAAAAPGTADEFRWAAGVGAQIADALAYAHRQGVTHRDVKPSNLLLDEAGAVWVADFGLAQIAGQAQLTATGGFVGTRQYMAPEQYHGWADPRSDVYSLGVTLYELLTLTPAFDAPTPEAVVRRILDSEVTAPRRLNPAIPRDLETIVLKAMAAEPAHRYATADALAADLRRFLEGQPIAARRVATPERVWRWARKNRLAAGLLVALGLVMAATTVASVWAAFRFDHMRKESDQARATIAKQFDEVRRADREAKEQLSNLLLRTAQAELSTRRPGGRPQALAALREAARLSRQLDLPPEHRTALRQEYVAALATIDVAVRKDQTWELPSDSEDLPLGYSRDGTRYAVSDREGEVSVRDTANNRQVLRLGEQGGLIHHLRFSPGGRYLAGVQGGKLRLWRLADGKPIPLDVRVSGNAFDFHPDESAVAFVTSKLAIQPTYAIQVRELPTGEQREVGTLRFSPRQLRFDRAGRRLAACHRDVSAVHVLAVADGTETTFDVPGGAASVAWSPHESRLAAGGEDGSVRVFDPAAPEAAPLVLSGHRGQVVNLAFHPHDDILVSGSWDDSVRLWDLTHPAAAVRVVFSSGLQVLEFSADGRSLGLGRDSARAWVWEVLLPTVGHPVVRGEKLWGAALSPDGRCLAGMGMNGLRLWDLQAGTRPAPVALDVPTAGGRRARFSEDGRTLTAGTTAGVAEYAVETDAGGRLRAARAREWGDLWGDDHWWSPDRTLLAVVPSKRVADVSEWPSRTSRFTAEHRGRLEYLSFSPDNRWLAGGAWQRRDVKVWDVNASHGTAGAVVKTFPTAPSARPVFSPDGRWLVIGTGAAYQFHEAGTWKPGLRLARVDGGENPATGAFTPDCATFAGWSRPGVVTLYDSRDGRELVSLPITARTGSVDTYGELQFAAEGRKLLVVADGRHVQVWDIADLREQLAKVGLDWESAPAQAGR